MINVLLEGTPTTSMVSALSASDASNASTRSVSTMNDSMVMNEGFECFDRDLYTATASMQRLLVNAPEGLLSPEDKQSIQQVIGRLRFSPDGVDNEAHEQYPVVAAIPTTAVCSRCEQPGHTRRECQGACAACGFAWPECDINCPMRYDESDELLMTDEPPYTDSEHPPVQTCDLDSEEYRPLPNTVATSLSRDLATTTDEEVIRQYAHVLRDRFASRFPSVRDMPPAHWLAIVDMGQLARLCRATGSVVETMEKYSVKQSEQGSAGHQNAVRWDTEARQAVTTQQKQLADTVRAVADEIGELLDTIWDQ